MRRALALLALCCPVAGGVAACGSALSHPARLTSAAIPHAAQYLPPPGKIWAGPTGGTSIAKWERLFERDHLQEPHYYIRYVGVASGHQQRPSPISSHG